MPTPASPLRRSTHQSSIVSRIEMAVIMENIPSISANTPNKITSVSSVMPGHANASTPNTMAHTPLATNFHQFFERSSIMSLTSSVYIRHNHRIQCSIPTLVVPLCSLHLFDWLFCEHRGPAHLQKLCAIEAAEGMKT